MRSRPSGPPLSDVEQLLREVLSAPLVVAGNPYNLLSNPVDLSELGAGLLHWSDHGALSVVNPTAVFAGVADPTAQIGLAAVNGSALTAMRSDAAPALSQAITPTWNGLHTFSVAPRFDIASAAAGLLWTATGVDGDGVWEALSVADIPDLSATYSPVAHTHTFASLTSKPTTFAGYGITSPQVPIDFAAPGYASVSVYSTDVSGVVGTIAANAASEFRVGTTSNHPLAFYTNGLDRGRFDTAGKLSLPVAPQIDIASAAIGYVWTATDADGNGAWATPGTPGAHTHDWADITGEPTTLAGYGITDAQPLDSDLTAIAALTTTAFGRGFLDLADAAGARSKLALGTMATETATTYLTVAAAAAAYQALDSDLGAIAALLTVSYGRGFLPLANAADARTYLGLGTMATEAASGYQPLDSDLTSIAALATTSYGRSFLPLADAAAGRSLLGLGTMATETATTYLTVAAAAAGYQPLDGDLTSIAALSTTSYGRSFLPLADAAAGRTLLGLGALALLGSPLGVANGGTNKTSWTAGSVAFAGASGTALAEDNANLFWDDTSNRLGILTALPRAPVHLLITSAGNTPSLPTYKGNFVIEESPSSSDPALFHGGIEWHTSDYNGGYGTRLASWVRTGLSSYFLFQGRIQSAAWTTLLAVSAERCVGINTIDWGSGAVGVLGIANGTAPGSSPANMVQLYSTDDAGGVARFHVRDEEGVITSLSPHDFSHVPEGKSEELAWSHYSEKNGKYIAVDMTRMIRIVEQLSGKKLIHVGRNQPNA